MALTEIKGLQELIKDSIGGEVVEQSVTSLLPPGENYGSVMYKVDFKVEKGGKEETIHAVAKCTPTNKVTQEMFNTQVTFKSEIAWYTTVIPTLKEFSRNQGVEKEIDFFQKFFGARISLDPDSDKVDLDGVILTENLKFSGYKNEDRHVGFDLPTSKAILRDLATFHALSLAIKEKDPDLFETKIKPCIPKLKMFEGEIKDFNKGILEVFEFIPECAPLMERVNKALQEGNPFKPRPVREPWATITHKDFWINNIMVTEGNDPKVIILDWQIPVDGSPAADVVFFLLVSVKLDVIETRLDELIKFYYDEFIKNLTQLKISTYLYPYEEFLREIRTEMLAGEFSHALHHIHIILGEKGTSTFSADDENFKFEDFAKNRIPVNDRHITKFKWITLEAAKRNWI